MISTIDIALKRLEARKAKDWETADSLRRDLESIGYKVEDTSERTSLIQIDSRYLRTCKICGESFRTYHPKSDICVECVRARRLWHG